MITTQSLSIHYGSVTALRNATLSIPGGSVTAIVGPSGCGKSSFLAALNRLTDLIPGARISGQVLLDGADIHDEWSPAQVRRRVGMIFQKPNPFEMSIRRNIQLALREHGQRDRRQLDAITEHVLRNVGLWDEVRDRLDCSALKLSGGQQQRLCLARSLALQPQVLLMDEPCSALDPIAAARVESLIRSLRGQYTLVVVTHNLAQARRIADHVAVFWNRGGAGEMLEFGPADQMFTAPTHPITAGYLAGTQG